MVGGQRCGHRVSIWSSTGGVLGGLHVFCAVLAWYRVRFVRFADNERADTTLALLAECFETLGGVHESPRVWWRLRSHGRVESCRH